MVPESLKVYLTTLSLEGEAELWYSGFVHEGAELTWEGLIEEVIARFSLEASDNPIEELQKLQQMGLVDEYRKNLRN